MDNAEKESFLKAVRQVLGDLVAFYETFQQPLGEQWKCVLWNLAKAIQEVELQQAAAQLSVFKVDKNIKSEDDLVRFCWKELHSPLLELIDESVAIQMALETLEKQVEHLRSTLRAVECTQTLMNDRLSAVEALLGKK